MSGGFHKPDMRRLRAYALSLMTDSCRVTRMGDPVTDPVTGVDHVPETLVYEGRCKVQTSGGMAAENVEGGMAQALAAITPQWSLYLHLPYGTTGLLPGDVATVTVAGDPNLAGRRLRLLNLQSEKTHATAQRWNVKEVASDADQG